MLARCDCDLLIMLKIIGTNGTSLVKELILIQGQIVLVPMKVIICFILSSLVLLVIGCDFLTLRVQILQVI